MPSVEQSTRGPIQVPADVAARFDARLRAALDQVARLREEFPSAFPGDHTVSNHYQARVWGNLDPGANSGWTTGFWSGLLWTAYELADDAQCRATAEAHLPSYAERIERRIDVDHHDMGFLYTLACVTPWHLTRNATARDIAIGAADTLLQRYLPQAGIIQAWGDLSDPRERGRIIIDCLMNMPLLHWASEETGRPAYREAALTHLERSRDHLVRADSSSHHTFYFDADSGNPLHGKTSQGVSDDSCWARGQAWGIYGFALNHRYAPQLGLLDVARRQADYFLSKLPANGIAYWDLSFGEGSSQPWDSSASAIAVCGLLELAAHLPDADEAQRYQDAALRILDALGSLCTAQAPASNAVLLHGVYSFPHGAGVDEASLWGDYFYVEALARVARNWVPHW